MEGLRQRDHEGWPRDRFFDPIARLGHHDHPLHAIIRYQPDQEAGFGGRHLVDGADRRPYDAHEVRRAPALFPAHLDRDVPCEGLIAKGRPTEARRLKHERVEKEDAVVVGRGMPNDQGIKEFVSAQGLPAPLRPWVTS